MSFDRATVDALYGIVAERLEEERRRREGSNQQRLQGDDEQQFAQKLIAEAITDHSRQLALAEQPPLGPADEQRLFEAVHARLFELDQELVRELARKVGNRLADERARRDEEGLRQLSDPEEQDFAQQLIAAALSDYAEELLLQTSPPLAKLTEDRLATAIHARIFGLGQLHVLLSDDSIENVDINGCDDVWVTRAGSAIHERVDPVAATDEELIEIVSGLASYAGLNSRPWDHANRQLDLQLPGGARLSAIMDSSARPSISIRRNRLEKVVLADLVGNGTVSQDAAEFLRALVVARKNLMIAGATRAGKTVLLRALSAEIGPEERVLTTESTLELNLDKDKERHPNCVAFEEIVANSEGAGAITMRDLVRRTKRQNPDRVIVGEVLGDEVIDMLQAMRQGNDGSMSTIHARSAKGIIRAITTYAVTAPERLDESAAMPAIAEALDFLIYVSRDMRTGARRLDTILEVGTYDGGVLGTNTIFALDETGVATYVGGDFAHKDDLMATGWVPPATNGWDPNLDGEWR